MKKFTLHCGPLFLLTVLLALEARAASIVWVSDNGAEGTTATTGNGPDGFALGGWYPAVSAGAPYVDQGFVDLLINAGHTVRRFNVPPRLSSGDIPALNTYDLIIVGSAQNSAAFNPTTSAWNTGITKPMIITKSTLIRGGNRLGWLTADREVDCGADLSTTTSGKLTFLQPSNPVFSGIGQTGGVMNNFCGIMVPFPERNRGTSIQVASYSIDDVDQVLSNLPAPGGTVLATLAFNPLDPGVNIAAGATPTVYPNYKVVGYAIAEWPAGTVVATQTLSAHRMLFACGTRDASNSPSQTGAPNPQVGALDLTADGQKMFLNAVGRALDPPAPLTLSSTWGQYDKTEIVNGGAGILVLSNQSATGFTAAVGENRLSNNAVPTPGIDGAGRPRIFQAFRPQALSKVGQKVRLSFKIKFNDIPTVGDTRFRFGFGDTAHNQAVLGMIDLGAPSNPSGGLRCDISISGTGSVLSNHVPGDWSDFGNTGAAPGASGTAFQLGNTIGSFDGAPNGVGLQDTTTTHLFTMDLERVVGGLVWTVAWGNDQGPQVLSMSTANIVDDSLLPMNSVDSIGIMNINDNAFGAVNSNTTGSFVVSEVSVTGEGHPTSGSALPFEIKGNSLSGNNLQLSWNSAPGVLYSVVSSPDLKEWTVVPGGASLQATGYSCSVSLPNQTAIRQFYQVRR